MKKTLAYIALTGMTSSLCSLAVPLPGGPPEPNHAPDVIKERVENIAWLGVGSRPVERLLAQHLQIRGGVVLVEVSQNSPAATAGLLKDDIITHVGNRAVSSQLDLREAILAQEPGAEVLLKVIRNGENIAQKVTLGKRPGRIARQEVQPFGGGQFFQIPQGGQFGNHQDLFKEMEERMAEMQKRFDNFGAGGNNAQDLLQKLMQQGNLGNVPGMDMQFHSNSSMSVRDAEGSIEVTGTGDQREIVVKDLNGKVVYEGPYVTDLDKAAVPAGVQERLDGANIAQNFDMQFKFPGLNAAEPEQDVPLLEQE